MSSDQEHEHEKQVVITLALIQQALQDLIARVNDHHKVLFGNGNPEESVVWAIKMLSKTIEKLEVQLDSFCDSKDDKIQRVESLTWTQWSKQFLMKWFPAVIIFTVIVALFHVPLTAVIVALATALGG